MTEITTKFLNMQPGDRSKSVRLGEAYEQAMAEYIADGAAAGLREAGTPAVHITVRVSIVATVLVPSAAQTPEAAT